MIRDAILPVLALVLFLLVGQQIDRVIKDADAAMATDHHGHGTQVAHDSKLPDETAAHGSSDVHRASAAVPGVHDSRHN